MENTAILHEGQAVLDIARRVKAGERVSRESADVLYAEASLFTLGALAHERRLAKAREIGRDGNIVSYVVDRNINYSNICACGCRFCAFFRAPGQEGGYVISREDLCQKIEETLEQGGTQILMQGGHHPELDLEFYESMLRDIKARYDIHIHAFSPPEIVFFADKEQLSRAEVIARLRKAGLDSIPGGGAEILVDEVRKKVSPNKCSVADWLDVMEEAHNQGMRTTATMMFGHEEQPGHRLDHLFALRERQDRTGGYTAFIPWTFQPENTNIRVRPQTSVSYLRILALSRIVLDNFDNVQVSWVTMGPKIAQLALFYGGNDFGSTMLEENVVAAANVRFRLTEHNIRRIVRAAGFEPRRRAMDYSLLESGGGDRNG